MRTLFERFSWPFAEGEHSMLVEDGRVVWRLPVGEAPTSVEADKVEDLFWCSLSPGYVDAHCHILPAGLAAGEIDLSGCASRDEALDVLRAASRDLPEGEWLVAGGYDQNRFADGMHLPSSQLTAVAGARPVLIKHRNGHAGIASASALAAARFSPGTDQVDGDGVLLEAAYNKMLRTLPTPSVERMVEAILAAGGDVRARNHLRERHDDRLHRPRTRTDRV
jgi:predicted amidohydrolase YtcJ